MMFSKKIRINITTAIVVVVMLLGTFSCMRDETDKISAVRNRSLIPAMSETKTIQLISDSGITRYRIYADVWNVYDKAKEPYWDFPKGIYFERFDEKLNINANFRSNTAKYYINKRLYEFNGKVRAVNIRGDMFETEQLFWDLRTERIYSNKTVKIIQPNKAVKAALGFNANQTLTEWKFKEINATFAVDENNSATP